MSIPLYPFRNSNFLYGLHEIPLDFPIAFLGVGMDVSRRMLQGSKKTPSGRPGQVDFPFGQVTFSPFLPDGQGPGQAVRRLNF